MRQLPDKNTIKEEGMLTIGGDGMMEDDGSLDAEEQPAGRMFADLEDLKDEEQAARVGVNNQPKLPRRNPKPPAVLTDASRFVAYFFIRFTLTALIYLLFFLWLLHASVDNDTLWREYYWPSSNHPHTLFNSSQYQSTLLAVQNYSMVVFVAMLAVHSMGFVYRYDSIKQTNPAKNKIWLISAIGCVILQVAFCVVSVFSVSLPAVDLDTFRWYVFLPWPFLIIAIDEICKAHDRRRRDFLHKKARQHFDTVLGMHSPK